MAFSLVSIRNSKSAIRYLPYAIIAVGIASRLVMYFHNRNLIIDEANIVRNLAERNFTGLTRPLSYEQYAPPIFLWIEKLASIVFGYSEKAMRVCPLLCGIGTLFVFPSIAKKFISKEVLWLPLGYLATGFIFLKYSAEVKQYMPDAFIALLIIRTALWLDIRTTPWPRFVLLWILIGSLAIWASMPSVFILAGVGCYYAWITLRTKQCTRLLSLILIAAIWIAQFGIYYYTILKAQINSSYLQNYHQNYFLFAFPTNADQWAHNWERIEDLLGNVGGWTTVAVVSNLIFLLIGFVSLFRKSAEGFMLIALPIILVLVAAALKQFSLIDRVVLFMLPLWIILIGIGFDWLWSFKSWISKGALLLVGAFNVIAAPHRVVRPYEFHEITNGMDWIKSRGARGNNLYIENATVPAYIYYTRLHPQKEKWTPLLGAHKLNWDDNFTQLTNNIKDTAYFLYTGGFTDEERQRRTHEIEQNMQQVAYFEHAVCYVFVYIPKHPTELNAHASAHPK